MVENKQILVEEENVEPVMDRTDAEQTSNDRGDGLVKTAIGALVGAVVGAVAVNLARKVTVENVNNTVKGVGEAVKGAAEGINNTVKGVGNAVKSVAENANNTVKDVGDAVKSVAEDVNQNVKGTVDVVKVATEGVNYTVKGTVDVLKGTAQEVNNTVKGAVDAVYEQEVVEDNNQLKTDEVGSGKSVETQTAYILVPVDKDRVVGRTIPTDTGTSVASGE